MANGKSTASSLPIPNSDPLLPETKIKKKKKKPKGPNVHTHDHQEEDHIENIPRLPNLNPQDFVNGRFNVNTPAGLNQAQSDLLATANDLYRQIESAAAAALAGHLPPTGNLPNRGDETADDAYWSSLPNHLRSFIRSALPLAAGLSPGSGNANGNPALNLTPEQMQQAAHQLAQVVQSAGWSGLGTTPNLQPNNFNHANGTRATAGATLVNGSATTTIPLGSFTLPLMPHPDAPDMSNEDFDEDDEGDLSETERSVLQESKSKKKKKKKKVSLYQPYFWSVLFQFAPLDCYDSSRIQLYFQFRSRPCSPTPFASDHFASRNRFSRSDSRYQRKR